DALPITGLDAPAFPVGFDHPAPSAPPAPPLHASGVSPAYNPWAPPPQGDINLPGVDSPFAATETTQGVVLEERAVTSSRVSKVEIALWVCLTLLSLTVICHRNDVFRHWFGANLYSLLEAQLIGRPDIDTVAGVRALLAETGASSER